MRQKDVRNEYWLIKFRRLDVEYYWAGWLGWSNERLRAVRYLTRENALSDLRNIKVTPNTSIVHVRIRPRSERLWMAERLKQWETVVRAAHTWRHAWHGFDLATQTDEHDRALVDALDALPEEHRPSAGTHHAPRAHHDQIRQIGPAAPRPAHTGGSLSTVSTGSGPRRLPTLWG